MSIITGPGAYRNEAGERVEIVGGDLSGYWAGTNNNRYCSNGAPCPCYVCDGASPIVGPWVAPAYLDAGAASFAGLEAEREEDYFERLWATAVREKHEAWAERDHAIEERDTARAARARAQQHLQEVTWQLKEARLYATGLERERDALYVKLAAVREAAGEGA